MADANCFYCGEKHELPPEKDEDREHDDYLTRCEHGTKRLICTAASCHRQHNRHLRSKGIREWVICDDCNGEGRRVHPACSVWTSSDIAEDFEAFEGMMAGNYDVTCTTCNGTGKVDMVRQVAEYEPPDLIAESERRMGC
jgi:DnaJ-class molecular chaperone